MRARSAPHRSIAAIVASSTPVAAPRQPAWAAPMTPACWSASSTGPQSAVVTPMARPGVRVTMASARGRSCAVHGRSIVTDVGRMDLIGGEEAIRPHPERRRHAGAVLGDVRGRVLGARAAIEAGIDAVGHAAVAREEGVPDAGERGECGGLQAGLPLGRAAARGLGFVRHADRVLGALRRRSRAGARASGRTRRAP